MTRCPRCRDEVDQLYPLPVESLRSGVRERVGSDETTGRVCFWCRHELLEK